MPEKDTIKDWVKLHKKEFILQLVETSGALPEDNPAAIFMAGLPGAGKTEFSKRLIEFSGVPFVRIDMDEIAEQIDGYRAEDADKFRLAATTLLSETFNFVLKKKYSFVMDGTFGNPKAKMNIERALKHGFNVKLIYVYQDPKPAWEFTLAREKVEHRAIQFDGFIEAYYKTIGNIKEIIAEYGDRIGCEIVIKKPSNEIGLRYKNVEMAEIDKIIKTEYNKDKLIQYIKGEPSGA